MKSSVFQITLEQDFHLKDPNILCIDKYFQPTIDKCGND
jgi:hypothetical protein